MHLRVRWVGIASLAVLLAAPCLAQDTLVVGVTEKIGAVPGYSGIGGMIGASYFYADEEYSKGALPRFDLSGHFRYVFNPWLRLQVSPGFTWSAYSKQQPPPFVDVRFPDDPTKETYLTLLLPVSAQLQTTRRSGAWIYFLGAGPGVYRVWVQNHRKVLMDPQSLQLHRGVYLGATAELGAERFFQALPSTSFEVSLANHFVFAQRDEQFPTGWNSMLSALALRVGANYYFDPKRVKEPELPLPPGAR